MKEIKVKYNGCELSIKKDNVTFIRITDEYGCSEDWIYNDDIYKLISLFEKGGRLDLDEGWLTFEDSYLVLCDHHDVAEMDLDKDKVLPLLKELI